MSGSMKIYCIIFLVCTLVATSVGQDKSFADHFSNCHLNDPNFDECVKNALNDVRPFFKTGLPQYGVAPFDPFFAREVLQKRGGPNMNYRLMLKNVTESGWTVSRVTDFKSDLNRNRVRYTQFFPDKRLRGDYEIVGNMLGTKFSNEGTWNLNLFDFVQTTTVSRKPRRASNGTMIYDTPVKVNVNVQTCENLELHISNLLRGRSVLETMLDRIINSAWQPGFVILRPLIDDLVSTAFTDIFTQAFRNFPFHEVIR